MKIEIEDLRKIQGIGNKTIERIYDSLTEPAPIEKIDLTTIPSFTQYGITIYNGEALQVMGSLDIKFDLVLTDPPFGITQCKWDHVIPFDSMWDFLYKISYINTPIVLLGVEPFASNLRVSNLQYYKYDWVWDKVNKFSGFMNAKKQPMRQTERVMVFYKKPSLYKPIMTKGEPYVAISSGRKSDIYNKIDDKIITVSDGYRYPRDIIKIKGDARGLEGRIHPTQKPVALMEYLIETYTNEGDTVLDFTMGSGTTMIACQNTGRKGVGIELDEGYYEIAKERIIKNYKQ